MYVAFDKCPLAHVCIQICTSIRVLATAHSFIHPLYASVFMSVDFEQQMPSLSYLWHARDACAFDVFTSSFSYELGICTFL